MCCHSGTYLDYDFTTASAEQFIHVHRDEMVLLVNRELEMAAALGEPQLLERLWTAMDEAVGVNKEHVKV